MQYSNCTYDFKYTSVECSFKALMCVCVCVCVLIYFHELTKTCETFIIKIAVDHVKCIRCTSIYI
jgi:hypothetical protein